MAGSPRWALLTPAAWRRWYVARIGDIWPGTLRFSPTGRGTIRPWPGRSLLKRDELGRAAPEPAQGRLMSACSVARAGAQHVAEEGADRQQHLPAAVQDVTLRKTGRVGAEQGATWWRPGQGGRGGG